VLEAIMIRVNDRVVTISDFRDRLRQELAQLPERPTGTGLTAFAESLFATAVDEMVLLERAQEKQVQVEGDAVSSAITSLREDNNLLDDNAFRQALESAGLTEEMLKERYRQNILLHRVVQAEVKPAEITEEELRQRYEADKDRYAVPAKVELEQLSFSAAADGSDRDRVAQRARGLVERVRQGSDLVAEATLAGVEVQELGAIPATDLRTDLAAALESVAEGGLTDPLDYPGGVQVLRLVRRIPAGFQPFEEVREELRRQRSQELYQGQTRGLVDRLKQNYLVEAHPELLPQALGGLG
jgi:parvulin-like peptidyl-prolyl isomerase